MSQSHSVNQCKKTGSKKRNAPEAESKEPTFLSQREAGEYEARMFGSEKKARISVVKLWLWCKDGWQVINLKELRRYGDVESMERAYQNKAYVDDEEGNRVWYVSRSPLCEYEERRLTPKKDIYGRNLYFLKNVGKFYQLYHFAHRGSESERPLLEFIGPASYDGIEREVDKITKGQISEFREKFSDYENDHSPSSVDKLYKFIKHLFSIETLYDSIENPLQKSLLTEKLVELKYIEGEGLGIIDFPKFLELVAHCNLFRYESECGECGETSLESLSIENQLCPQCLDDTVCGHNTLELQRECSQ